MCGSKSYMDNMNRGSYKLRLLTGERGTMNE
jgi:hypothetical protein